MTQGGKGSATLPERRVQSFLYLLLRDYLPSGDIELLFEMLRETDYDGPIIYSCSHIEALSGDMARRLLGTGLGMSDNEEGQHEDRKEDNEEDSRPEESVKDLSDREREAFRRLDEALEDFRAKATKAIFSQRPVGQGVYYESSKQPRGNAEKVRATGEAYLNSRADLDKEYPEGHVFDYGEGLPEASVLDARVKADEEGGYPQSNEDDARVREAEEEDHDEQRKRMRVISEEKDDDFSSEGYDRQGFNAKGIDAQGYNREGIFVQKQEDGGFLTSSGFPITEEEIIAQCLEGENKATRIEDDDLGIDFLKEEIEQSFEERGSGSTGSTTSKSAAEGETQS